MIINYISGNEIDYQQILEKIRMLGMDIHHSLELNNILNSIVKQIRQFLASDRVIIYRFLPDGDGVIAEESVSPEYKSVLGQFIYDPCFNAKWIEPYRQEKIHVIENINSKFLDPCYKKLLTKLQVQANLVVPILVNKQNIHQSSNASSQVWGLLITQQCSSPRSWDSLEIDFLRLVATELGIAIKQVQQHQLLSPLNQNFSNAAVQTRKKLICSCSKTQMAEGNMAIMTTEKTDFSNQVERETLLAIQAFRHTNLMVSVYTLDGVTLLQNPAALSCYGDTLHPTSAPENVFLRHFVDSQIGQKAIDTIHLGKSFSVETQVRTNQGIRWHQMDIQCTLDPSTGDEIILVNERDITQQQTFLEERQQVEKQLRWQEALLRSMTDSSSLAFFVVDNRTDEIIYFNHRFCEIWGLEHLEAKMQLGGMKNNDIIPDCITLIADVPTFAQTCKPLQSEENRCTIEDEIEFVDGRTIRRFSSQIRDSQDQYFGRLYIFEDITARKEIESARRESEERYRSVISAMAEGIVLQQANGCITACNDSAERILGLTADQMMGRTSIDPRWRAIHEDGSSFPGETHPAIVTLRTGKPQFNVIMGVHKPDSSLSWISINSQPLFHVDELTPYAVVTSFADITARKQAELALQQQMEQERMVAAIAHHIRQSLDLEQILDTTVAEVRQVLQTDRVIIYRFSSDWSGVIVTESVGEGWKAILNMEIIDSYFVEHQGKSYQEGTIKVTPDIYTAGMTDCHLELLQKYQVRAKLVVPIFQGDRLWGFLVAHHCSAPREWQSWESELLQKLATQVAIAIQQSELYQKLQQANQQLENMALVDQLTQIANRRSFDRKLNDVWQNLLRTNGFVSLLLCDIDYFKQYNDTYGHTAGDDCLLLVAQALKQTIKRSTDLAARYGGEEFVVILTNTNRDGAVAVAQEIHAAIEQLNIPHATSAVKQHITLSIGIATLMPTPDMVPLDLIESADQALYKAKAQGRNRSHFR